MDTTDRRGTNAGGEVVFICNRRRLENNPPFLSQVTSNISNLHTYFASH